MKALVFLAVLIAMIVGLTGCSDFVLAGTHDEALTFRVTPAPDAKLEGAIRARLAPASIAADIESADADHVIVVVDADSVSTVTSLLQWRGGVALHLVDPAASFTPASTQGIQEKTDGSEHYWIGSPAAISAAIHGVEVADRKIVVERIDAKTVRSRVVEKKPLLDLHDCIQKVTTRDRGRSLHIAFKPNPECALAKGAELAAGKPVSVVTRNTTSLRTTVLDSSATSIDISFGTDIESYSRAAIAQKLLSTPPLPVMVREGSQRRPFEWKSAGAALVIPIILSLCWLIFVRRFDRSYPEPWWLVGTTFFLGALSVIPAALAEYGLMSASPYLSPHTMTLGGQLIGLLPGLLVFSLVVGGAEEGSKFLGAWSLARHRREFDEPVDGIIYAAASSLGFAAAENIKYFTAFRLSGTLVSTRAFLSVPGHLFFGAIWGYALGRTLVSKKKARVWLMLPLAAIAHGAFDTFLSIQGLATLSFGLYLGLAVLFTILLRRTLRWGRRESVEDVPVSSAERQLFPVGQHWMFLAYAFAFHVLAAVLFVVSIFYEVEHHRVGPFFVGFASLSLAAVGVCMAGMSSTVPLDVAIDARGVTFAGAEHRWEDILGADRSKRLAGLTYRPMVRLLTKRGEVLLGPADPMTLERLLAAVKRRLESK